MAQRLATQVLFFVWAAGSVFAQPVLFGAKGGVPLTNAFRLGGAVTGSSGGGNYFSNTKRYTVGPVVEVRLPRRLSVELDALYKHLNYDYTYYSFSPGSSGSYTHGQQNALNRWEFPLLLKYHLWNENRGFYLAAGPTVNHISGWHSNIEFYGQGVNGPFNNSWTSDARPVELTRRGTGGIVVEGGWDFHWGIVRASPELRYTRWVNSNFTEPPFFTPFLRSNQNQIEFLLGVTF